VVQFQTGLTKAEIDLAVYRSGTTGEEQAVVSANSPSYNNINTIPVVRSSGNVHVVCFLQIEW